LACAGLMVRLSIIAGMAARLLVRPSGPPHKGYCGPSGW
jgi:hypothetical protein